MMRSAGIGLLALGLAVALSQAGDDPAPEKPERPKAFKKKDAPADPAARVVPAGPDEPTKELLARVAKNMGTSEERLRKEDPGQQTRTVQDQIVKDLDELIKKAQDQQNQQSDSDSASSSGGGGSGGSSGQSSARKGSQKKQGQDSQQAKNDGGQQQPKGGQKKDQAAAGDKKDGQGQDPQQGGKDGGGGGTKSAQNKGPLADVFRDVWGHLPEQKRQEMDAYSRERFMAKYDELLRQYYRTIAEQGRKKDGE
jgi:hypothetical protein